MRRTFAWVAALALALTFAAPAAGHHITVTPPGGGNAPTDHAVGGPVLSQAQGQGLHVVTLPGGVVLIMPAAQSAGPDDQKGLVQACRSTDANPSAVAFNAPPFFTGCQHGLP